MNQESLSTDFRSILRMELALRQKRNARYSLRSFSRDIGLTGPRLSDVLNGRFGLSRKSAESVAERLRFSPEAKERFCDLVEAKHGRSRISREAAKQRLLGSAAKGEELGRARLLFDEPSYVGLIHELERVLGHPLPRANDLEIVIARRAL